MIRCFTPPNRREYMNWNRFKFPLYLLAACVLIPSAVHGQVSFANLPDGQVVKMRWVIQSCGGRSSGALEIVGGDLPILSLYCDRPMRGETATRIADGLYHLGTLALSHADLTALQAGLDSYKDLTQCPLSTTNHELVMEILDSPVVKSTTRLSGGGQPLEVHGVSILRDLRKRLSETNKKKPILPCAAIYRS